MTGAQLLNIWFRSAFAALKRNATPTAWAWHYARMDCRRFDDVRDPYLQMLYGIEPAQLRYGNSEHYLELSRGGRTDD